MMATEAERLRLVDRLEKAALRVFRLAAGLDAAARTRLGGTNAAGELRQAWQDFPECYGEEPPSAAECLKIVERIRAEVEADRKFAEALKRL